MEYTVEMQKDIEDMFDLPLWTYIFKNYFFDIFCRVLKTKKHCRDFAEKHDIEINNVPIVMKYFIVDEKEWEVLEV